MKRGFLLKAEEKKAAAKRRVAQKDTESTASSPTVTAAAQPSNSRTFKGFNVDQKGRLSGKLPYGNLPEQDKALPSDYDFKKARLVHKELDPTRSDFKEDMTAITTIPQPALDDESQCEWIFNGSTKAKVLNAPGYPARIPRPRHPDMYEVRSTPAMGKALFAKSNIKRGDIFLAERPLLVVPRAIRPLSRGPIPDHYTGQQIQQILMFEHESLLESAVTRLPKESQADFRALHNAHTNDGSGPLLGIIRTNGYAIDNLYDGSNEAAKYGAICNIGSRLNHSCMPNVRYYFKLNSFSFQFFALRDIKAGEQLFYAYCLPTGGVAQRQAELAPYGFVCECPACINATPETDKLRETFINQIDLFTKLVEGSFTITESVLENAVRLEKNMVKEGLDAESQYLVLLKGICSACAKLGKVEEGKKYGVLVESFKGCFRDDE